MFGSVLNNLRLITSNKRKSLAIQYLQGEGLEIGALFAPLKLPKGAVAKYVDVVSREESIRKFPELDASRIVDVDYVEDGMELQGILHGSQDFVIANHVLEHTPNPLQALLNWSARLKNNGILFVTIPIAEQCFDKGREITTLSHLIDDFELYQKGELKQLDQRNREHLVEWIRISEPNIAAMQTEGHIPSPEGDVESRLQAVDMSGLDIHFHTFTMESYLEMLLYVSCELDHSLKIEAVVQNKTELVSVLRKTVTNDGLVY